MLSFWNEKAKEDGFGGLTFAFQQKSYDRIRNKREKIFKYAIEYQPMWANEELRENDFNKFLNFLRDTKFRFFVALEKYFGFQRDAKMTTEPKKREYDKVWQYIVNHKPKSDIYLPGAFVDWDNTPRKDVRGSVFTGVTPEKFEKYMEIQIKRARDVYHKDMMFIFAWNEWAEGGYLEPDEKYGDAYLKAIKRALEKNNEFPSYDL